MFDQHRRFSRRQFVTATTAAAITATAGCSTVADWIGNQVLEEVNILNDRSDPINGRIEISDPTGEAILEESFELVAADATSDEENGNMAFYSDVWTVDGAYEIRIELGETEIEGADSATRTVNIADPDEDMLLVALGADEAEAPIAFRVGQSFSEIMDE